MNDHINPPEPPQWSVVSDVADVQWVNIGNVTAGDHKGKGYWMTIAADPPAFAFYDNIAVTCVLSIGNVGAEPVRLECGIEIHWRDPVKAGVKDGGAFTFVDGLPEDRLEDFIEHYRRDRDITAYRVRRRYTAHAAWDDPGEPTTITPEEREAALDRLMKEIGR